jgi:poly(A) polymerase
MRGIQMRSNLATTLSDDLKRRDFTINALAYDPMSREMVDEHNGKAILNERSSRRSGTRVSALRKMP